MFWRNCSDWINCWDSQILTKLSIQWFWICRRFWRIIFIYVCSIKSLCFLLESIKILWVRIMMSHRRNTRRSLWVLETDDDYFVLEMDYTTDGEMDDDFFRDSDNCTATQQWEKIFICTRNWLLVINLYHRYMGLQLQLSWCGAAE